MSTEFITLAFPVTGMAKGTPYAKAGDTVIIHCDMDPMLIMEHVKVERDKDTKKVTTVSLTGKRFPLHKNKFL